MLVKLFSFLCTGVQHARLTLGCQVAAPACWPTWPVTLWSVDVATLCTPEESFMCNYLQYRARRSMVWLWYQHSCMLIVTYG